MTDTVLITSELGEICAITATNRQILIDGINSRVELGFFANNPDASYLHVALMGEGLGCPGCSAEYKTEADVPSLSVPCPCGNPKHWLIKYEGE
ncbi:MAG: hypothetical protein MUO99_01905 [Dehalococcoidales bacterium]|nr:hypothetical protein [Dehalococcoidales bacterium]